MHVYEVIFAVTAATTITLAYIGLFHVIDAFSQGVTRARARRLEQKLTRAVDPLVLAHARKDGVE